MLWPRVPLRWKYDNFPATPDCQYRVPKGKLNEGFITQWLKNIPQSLQCQTKPIALRAAYALALNAELDASVSSEFLPFRVQSNPVASTGSLSHYNNAREQTLTEEELHTYWRRLDKLKSEPIRAALKLALLLGGQRGRSY